MDGAPAFPFFNPPPHGAAPKSAIVDSAANGYVIRLRQSDWREEMRVASNFNVTQLILSEYFKGSPMVQPN